MCRMDLSSWNKKGERKREEVQKGNSQKIAESVKTTKENVTCFGNLMSIEPPYCWRVKTKLWTIPNIYLTRCNITQFILSGNCSACFGWYHHPSTGGQTTVSTAPGICHTFIVICPYCGRVGTGLSALWVAYATLHRMIITLITQPSKYKFQNSP